MTVRPRKASDLAGCVEALADVHAEDGYPTRWPGDPASWLSPPAQVRAWVAVDRSAPLGHVALVAGVKSPQLAESAHRPADEMATVSRLFVRPCARGAGLGETLLRTAMAYAAAHDLRLVLDVVDEARSAAIRLYERLGWTFAGRAPASWLTPSGDRPVLRLYTWQEAIHEAVDLAEEPGRRSS